MSNRNEKRKAMTAATFSAMASGNSNTADGKWGRLKDDEPERSMTMGRCAANTARNLRARAKRVNRWAFHGLPAPFGIR